MTNINLSNLIHSAGMEAIQVMTMLGNEYEFEWYEAAVQAAGKVYLKVTSPADKFTLVNFREVRHDQTKGFYRQYRPTAFSGGAVTQTITPVKMRGDSTLASAALVQVVTAPTITGAAFSSIPLWGGEGVGNRPQGGGLSQQGAFRVIPPGAVTLLEFENNSANPAQWYAYFKQFEISAAAMTQAAEV